MSAVHPEASRLPLNRYVIGMPMANLADRRVDLWHLDPPGRPEAEPIHCVTWLPRLVCACGRAVFLFTWIDTDTGTIVEEWWDPESRRCLRSRRDPSLSYSIIGVVNIEEVDFDEGRERLPAVQLWDGTPVPLPMGRCASARLRAEIDQLGLRRPDEIREGLNRGVWRGVERVSGVRAEGDSVSLVEQWARVDRAIQRAAAAGATPLRVTRPSEGEGSAIISDDTRPQVCPPGEFPGDVGFEYVQALVALAKAGEERAFGIVARKAGLAEELIGECYEGARARLKVSAVPASNKEIGQ